MGTEELVLLLNREERQVLIVTIHKPSVPDHLGRPITSRDVRTYKESPVHIVLVSRHLKHEIAELSKIVEWTIGLVIMSNSVSSKHEKGLRCRGAHGEHRGQARSQPAAQSDAAQVSAVRAPPQQDENWTIR